MVVRAEFLIWGSTRYHIKNPNEYSCVRENVKNWLLTLSLILNTSVMSIPMSIMLVLSLWFKFSPLSQMAAHIKHNEHNQTDLIGLSIIVVYHNMQHYLYHIYNQNINGYINVTCVYPKNETYRADQTCYSQLEGRGGCWWSKRGFIIVWGMRMRMMLTIIMIIIIIKKRFLLSYEDC